MVVQQVIAATEQVATSDVFLPFRAKLIVSPQPMHQEVMLRWVLGVCLLPVTFIKGVDQHWNSPAPRMCRTTKQFGWLHNETRDGDM